MQTTSSLKPLTASFPFKNLVRPSLFVPSQSTSDNSACSPLNGAERLSCLKGSQTDGMKSKKRKVQFKSSRMLLSVQKIDPFFEYARDLWWTKAELEAFKAEQSDFSQVSGEMKISAMNYLSAYARARKQVFPPDQRLDKPMMTADVYDVLVMGRSKGFAGLELYSDESRSRRAGVREISLLTLAAYYDFKNVKELTKVDKMLRSYSRSLTTADRYWGVAMGNADYAAATADTNDEAIHSS